MRSLLIVALLVAPAVADPTSTKSPDVRAMHTDDCAKARAKNKPCIIDMGKADEVEGRAVLPNGTGVAVIPTGKQGSLIHFRQEFIVEILKSAEDL